MLIVLSPAKSLDYESSVSFQEVSSPVFVEQAAGLIADLRKKSSVELQKLMSISEALAELNVRRFQTWKKEVSLSGARQAVFAFNGDVYDGLDVKTWASDDLLFAQNHLRILSGLYGVLRPLDLIYPYRLEMGTGLMNSQGKNLYAYWKHLIAPELSAVLRGDVLVNLASDEYFKAVDIKALDGSVVQPVFQDYKNGQYKVISFFAKKARGLMARYIIKNRISDVNDLKNFDDQGYQFVPEESSETELLFRRKEAQV